MLRYSSSTVRRGNHSNKQSAILTDVTGVTIPYISYPDLYSLSGTYNNVRVTLRTARALALTIYFAASSPQHNGNPSGKLHSRLKGGFVRTQRTPLVTGLNAVVVVGGTALE